MSIYNITEIVHFLNEYGKEAGIIFHVEFPESSIAKERIVDDLTKNPQEQIKSGLTIRDTVISITGKYLGKDNINIEDSIVSFQRAPIGQAGDIIQFELLGSQPFDHVIMTTKIQGLTIHFVNVIETAGSKGFSESLYVDIPPSELTEQWTRDVYEQLASVIIPDISHGEVASLSNTELKTLLNENHIDLSSLSDNQKFEVVRNLAVEFIDKVKNLDTTQFLIEHLQAGTEIQWNNMIDSIVESSVKKGGATAPFTVKLSNDEFSRHIFGGFSLGRDFEKIQAGLGASEMRDMVELHQLNILKNLASSDNSIVLLCENNKANAIFTEEAKWPLFIDRSSDL